MRATIIAVVALVTECGPADRDYVDHSDELIEFADAFEEAESQLLADGECDDAELERGWFKSTAEMSEPTFLIYCGGYSGSDRIYLNIESGKLYRS